MRNDAAHRLRYEVAGPVHTSEHVGGEAGEVFDRVVARFVAEARPRQYDGLDAGIELTGYGLPEAATSTGAGQEERFAHAARGWTAAFRLAVSPAVRPAARVPAGTDRSKLDVDVGAVRLVLGLEELLLVEAEHAGDEHGRARSDVFVL